MMQARAAAHRLYADFLMPSRLDSFERLLGADDFHVAMTLDHVAEAYAGQAHYAEAEEFYGRVLAILTPRLGSDNPVVRRVLTERARARRHLELSGAKKS